MTVRGLRKGTSDLISSTGYTAWRHRSVPSPTNDSFGVPPLIVPSDGLIFEATVLGTLDAYRLDNGRQVMSINLGSPLYFGSSMAIGENMLVVDTNAGLMAFSSR